MINVGETEIPIHNLRRRVKELQAQNPDSELSPIEEEYIVSGAVLASFPAPSPSFLSVPYCKWRELEQGSGNEASAVLVHWLIISLSLHSSISKKLTPSTTLSLSQPEWLSTSPRTASKKSFPVSLSLTSLFNPLVTTESGSAVVKI